MKSAIVIPARYASSRLPGKLLLPLAGKPILQHAYERAKQSCAERVIIATDDERIADAARKFDAECIMTRADHQSGADRVAEAAAGLDADIIVNLQGDEPEIDPASLDALIALQARAGAFASTLACPFPKSGAVRPEDPNCVKAVVARPAADGVRYALYFSRALTPYPRDDGGKARDPAAWLHHIGVYAFTRKTLASFAAAPPSPLEICEKLEQLRILEMGERIAVAVVERCASGIDTAEDYEKAKKRFQSQA
ncbi:MAG: 3-deoxy-manno-octulosonate cytidylyltransferase [Parvularculaceae bacterium]